MKKATVRVKDGYLCVYMPSGEILPCQTDIKIENNVDQFNQATVTVSFIADVSVMSDEYLDKNEALSKVNELSFKLKESGKRELLWKKAFIEENKKKWYQKLFNY